jgi:hypothetical protein
MKMSLVMLLLCTGLTIGCTEEKTTAATTAAQTASAAAAASTPEELGRLGAQIKKNPGEATRLLSEKGHTQASFAAAIREVTENQDASQRYAAAFREEEARPAQ